MKTPATRSGPSPAPPRRSRGAARHRIEPPSRLTLAALFFAAVLLLPACTGALRALRMGESLFGGGPFRALGLSGPLACFLGGGTLFALAYFLFRIPPRPYVAVHEATHALVGLLFGARVSRMRIGEESGSVDVSRSNAAILLAPYFLPLPAVAVLLVFGLGCAVAPLRGTAAGAVFAVLAGLAWGFHFCFTLNALLQPQTDLDAYGFFFSCVSLFFLNAVLLYFSLLAFGAASLPEGLRLLSDSIGRSYEWLWDWAFSLRAASEAAA
ncbi:MAG: hypothetical protein IJV65_09795 [Kiritimatiellae bacterium]|nr:hypothetical protein [Kiritimatiellia bacterium]